MIHMRIVLAADNGWGSSMNPESKFPAICPNFSPLLRFKIFYSTI